MNDIKNYDKFAKIELVNKGWSNDKKYYIVTKDNDKLLLRISDIKELDRKKMEFDIMSQVYALGVQSNYDRIILMQDDNQRQEIIVNVVYNCLVRW